MRFVPVTDTVLEERQLSADYESADRFGWLLIGKQCIFYKGVLKAEYLPLSEVVWAYMRQEDSRTKMCCGKMTLESFFLMVTARGGAQRKTSLQNKREVKKILALLEERSPQIDIGYSKEKAEKYLP